MNKSSRNIDEIKQNFEAINRAFHKNFYGRNEYTFLQSNIQYYLYNTVDINWQIIGLNNLDTFLIDMIEYKLLESEMQKYLYVVIQKELHIISVKYYIFDKEHKDIKTEFEYNINDYEYNYDKLKEIIYDDIEKNISIFINDKNLIW